MAVVKTDIIEIGAGGYNYPRPPAGEDWEVQLAGCDTWVGTAPNGVPQVNVGIYDGVASFGYVLKSTDIAGWGKRRRLFLNNSKYLALANPGGAAVKVAYSAKRSRPKGTSTVRTVHQSVATTGVLTVRPPQGEEWLVTAIGSTQWVGTAPAAVPDLKVELTDGTHSATILIGTNKRGWSKELEIYINNNTYLKITNTNASTAGVCVSAKLLRIVKSGADSVVASKVETIAGNGSLTLIPPAGVEMKVTEVGAETWIGTAPDAFPDVSVKLTDGTKSAILARKTDTCGWNAEIEAFIDNDDYLAVTDTSAAEQDIGVSAVKVNI